MTFNVKWAQSRLLAKEGVSDAQARFLDDVVLGGGETKWISIQGRGATRRKLSLVGLIEVRNSIPLLKLADVRLTDAGREWVANNSLEVTG